MDGLSNRTNNVPHAFYTKWNGEIDRCLNNQEPMEVDSTGFHKLIPMNPNDCDNGGALNRIRSYYLNQKEQHRRLISQINGDAGPKSELLKYLCVADSRDGETSKLVQEIEKLRTDTARTNVELKRHLRENNSLHERMRALEQHDDMNLEIEKNLRKELNEHRRRSSRQRNVLEKIHAIASTPTRSDQKQRAAQLVEELRETETRLPRSSRKKTRPPTEEKIIKKVDESVLENYVPVKQRVKEMENVIPIYSTMHSKRSKSATPRTGFGDTPILQKKSTANLYPRL